MKTGHTPRAPTDSRKRLSIRVVAYAGLLVFSAAAVCLLFPGLCLNRFLENRLVGALTEANPNYIIRIAGVGYDIWENRLACDSVSVTELDSTPVVRTGMLSVTGIARTPLLLGGGNARDLLAAARGDARDVAMNVPSSSHEIRFPRLRISVPDSSMAIDSIEFRPLSGDEEFFAGSGYRRTSYHLVIPVCSVTGLDVSGAIGGGGICARAIRFEEASLRVLLNKDKPVNEDAPDALMPGELLASIGAPLSVDSLSLENGRIVYGERFDIASGPAMLSFDGIQVTAEGIGNAAGRDDTTVVRARGRLMGAGEVSMLMSMPVGSTGLSFRYSGRLGGMDLHRFNPFVETSEHVRLKTGVLHGISFNVDVSNGSARGTTSVVYEDLKLVAIEDGTGSESGISNTVLSFIANNIKLRTTNIPDESGSMKVGEVKYRRETGEAFLEFAWFSLRSGIGDVVGF